ncbi:RodZ domain-containing protein [Modicisalibacter coralii]|uniref:RodZ domain-containing protein n=1 Tax=Modicisalibacter coralii TaxID=2304602 RepID=UPI00100BB722|nr:RodZ domain-containing protein [Halomonas coralii]
MSDTPQRHEASLDPDVNARNDSPGELLRRERERQGLSLEEVAVQLNLRPAVVTGLESDQYSEIPIAAYRRGYLRAYARLMGLEESEVVGAYNRLYGDTKSDIDRRITPVQVSRPPSRVGAWVIKLFTLLVIAGLIGLTLVWWQSRNGNDLLGLGDSEETATQSVSDAPASESTNGDITTSTGTDDENLPPLPEKESQLGLVDDNDAPAQGGEDATATPADGDPASEQANATATPTTDAASTTGGTASAGDTPAAGNTGDATGADDDQTTAAAESTSAAADNARRLSFTFNEQSWTEIFDANDRRILVGLQSAGTQATAEGEPPFRLTIGNASGVELSYRGKPVDLGAHTGGNNVARFTLGESLGE